MAPYVSNLIQQIDDVEAPQWLKNLDKKLKLRLMLGDIRAGNLDSIEIYHTRVDNWVSHTQRAAVTHKANEDALTFAKAVRCLLKRRINTHAGLPAFAHVPEADVLATA